MMSDRRVYLIALFIAAVLFFGSCWYGYSSSLQEPEAADEIAGTFRDSTAELSMEAPAMLSWQIFFNNVKVCLILFIGGGVTFGGVTFFVLISNGYVIGNISGVMLRGYDVSVFAATIVPHGIFEIFAMLMASALGLQMGRSLFLDGMGKDNAGTTCLWYGTRFFLVVLPLLIIAAFVEAFVTPAISMLVLFGM